MLDEPSNMLDLNAIAWLEDYLQTWESTLLVVSHDRAFLDSVATDIVHQHSQRLDYYKGNFSQFYATKTERQKNQKKEYEAQLQYRQHLQAFIDRWRYNANRGGSAPAAAGARRAGSDDVPPRLQRLRRSPRSRFWKSCPSSSRPRRTTAKPSSEGSRGVRPSTRRS